MGTIALYRHLHGRGVPVRRSRTAASPKSILRRIVAAIEGWHQRRADQEAARFIAAHGGRLTDDVERQLAEHWNRRGFTP